MFGLQHRQCRRDVETTEFLILVLISAQVTQQLGPDSLNSGEHRWRNCLHDSPGCGRHLDYPAARQSAWVLEVEVADESALCDRFDTDCRLEECFDVRPVVAEQATEELRPTSLGRHSGEADC